MSKINTLIDLLKNNRSQIKVAFISNLAKTKISHLIPDKIMLKMQFRLLMDMKLDLEHPKTFNEKLQWLKLYDRNPKTIELVDKYKVREYVELKIGEEYLIPLIGVWNDYESINFDSLPNEFVIKCTHDSGSVVVCEDKNKIDLDKVKDKIKHGLKNNMFWHGREWPYKNVKPRIIVEKFMKDYKTDELRDYKFFCFGGDVKFFKIDYDRFTYHRANYYSKSGELLPFGEKICPPDYSRSIKMPVNLEKMIELAEILSSGYCFMRVDFYEVNNKIYFGELTFFPASGLSAFTDNSWDYEIGSYVKLPQKRK